MTRRTGVSGATSFRATNLPIVIWLMRDYFQTIPIELEECAAIDGASRYRILGSIVLPLSVPGLVAMFLFVLVFAWNEHLLALFFGDVNLWQSFAKANNLAARSLRAGGWVDVVSLFRQRE